MRLGNTTSAEVWLRLTGLGENTYLGMTLTELNRIYEEKNNRLKSGIACYHLVQNVLQAYFYTLSKHIKVSLTSEKEHRLGIFETCILYV
jgi:hypothetical protein